jgi:hypothetical protein
MVTDNYLSLFHCMQHTQFQLQAFFLYLAKISLTMYVFSDDITAPFCAMYQMVFRYTLHPHTIEQNNGHVTQNNQS